MKITENDILKDIEFIKHSIRNFESQGLRGSKGDYERFARCELLLGNIIKAREYFEESDKSWLWYLDYNREYIKTKWTPDTFLWCYETRILIQFFAYGYDRTRDYVSSNLDRIKKLCEENTKIIERGWKHSPSDMIAFEKKILLYVYLTVKDKESASEVIKEIYERFNNSKNKTFKKGKLHFDAPIGGTKYPAVLHAKLVATIADGIIEKNKELFLNGFKKLSELQKEILTLDESLVDYADLKMLFFLEIARQTWPDLAVESPYIPEKLRTVSYFEELKGI